MITRLLSLFVLIFLMSFSIIAQNLVPNNSFEDAWTCPYSFFQYSVAKPFPGWYNPSKGTPDHLHVCSTGDAGVPENFAGFAYPYDGAAYAGIILREIFDDSTGYYEGVSREYIQTKLIMPLKREKLYCVKLYYMNASKSLFAVDALGVALTVDRIARKDAGLIIQHPQVINKPENILDNQDEWMELCGIYRAKGEEKYLTIGNFWDNSVTKYIRHNNKNTDSSFFYAYYYIDNVSIFEIENEFECGCLNNNSYGSDWLSDLYDPETGYNSKTLADISLNSNLTDNNSNYETTDQNTWQNTDAADGNIVISDLKNSSDSLSQNNNDNGTFSSNSNNNIGADSRSFFYGVPESEINEQAFKNAEVGTKFNLNRILFEFNSAELLTVSFTELDKLSEILKNNPKLRIEIRGHTDEIGSSQYNKRLSNERAAAVYEYLLKKGIAKSRMKYRGFGEKVPVADNSNEEGRRLNRRVEIVVVEI